MENIEELELTRNQRLAGNITAGAVTILTGLFLLLCGVDAIKLNVRDIALGCVLLAIGLVFFITAIISKNTLSLWLSWAFIVPALVEFLAKYSDASYAELYPLYIAIPAIGCIAVSIYNRRLKPQIVAIIFFACLAAIFALASSGLLGFRVVIPIIIVFVGLTIVLYALKSSKNDSAAADKSSVKNSAAAEDTEDKTGEEK